MKKITVTLTDEAEKVFNEIMYALPREEDETDIYDQSEAICYILQRMDQLKKEEKSHEERIKELIGLSDNFRKLVEDQSTPEISEEEIKVPYPDPVSDHQRSKNVGYIMGYRAALSKGAKPMSEWISVKERLPEESKDFLVGNKWYIPSHHRYAFTGCIMRFSRKHKRFYPTDNDIDPTHWMPLPEAPKELNNSHI